MTRLALLAVATLMLAACGGAPRGPLPDASTVSALPALDIAALERAIHVRVNRTRQQHGLSQLAWNDDLHPIARGHSADMADRNRFAHVLGGRDVTERYVDARYTCRVPAGSNRFLTGGENLYLGNRVARWQTGSDGTQRAVDVPTIEQLAFTVVDGWMHSPGHRANLLTPHWRTEAIAVVTDRNGRLWVTQNFC